MPGPRQRPPGETFHCERGGRGPQEEEPRVPNEKSTRAIYIYIYSKIRVTLYKKTRKRKEVREVRIDGERRRK